MMRFFAFVTTIFLLSISAYSQQTKISKHWSIPKGISQKDIVPNMVIVKTRTASASFKDRLRLPAIESIQPVKKENATVRATKNSLSNVYLVQFDNAIDHETVINTIINDVEVVYAEPMYIRHISYVPNDPLKSSQSHLAQIKAFEGWDILNDASDVIVAIVDSGVALGHVDLTSNIYLNSEEIADNGIDDDEDGYIDNYLGWDFVGASISDIINAGSPVNWDLWEDNNPDTDGSDHGTHVAGIASAGFDNGVGISGVGAGAKIMALKCGENAGGSYPRSIFRGYDAIIYAAEHGADIINCSWGGAGYSQFEQDVIDYATELGSLIVAAASNDGNSELSYPASYENVLSVSNVKSDDLKASSSTFNFMVDVAAPGSDIFSTVFGSDYGLKTGTSMSSPVVAGVAALVKAKRPNLTPAQIGEVIRVTSDDINPLLGTKFKYKMGKGRVNVLRALTETSPSVRFRNVEFVDEDFSLQSGDEVGISLDFINYLDPVSNLSATLKVDNSSITILDGTESIGDLGTMSTTSKENAFTFKISDTAKDNLEITFRVEFSNGAGYTDWQAYTVVVNPTYINIINSEYATSVTSIGRLGYLESGANPVGLGLIYNEENLLYEMGFLIGTSGTSLSNSVRTDVDPDDDFKVVNRIASELNEADKRASFDFKGTMDDSNASNPIGLAIDYNVLAWKEDGSNKFFIVEYTVNNATAGALTDIYSGLYSDWDLLDDAAANISGYDATRKLGYITTNAASEYFVGLSVLSNDLGFNYKAIDNSAFEFTNANKFSAISGGLGTTVLGSSDVSNFIGLGPFDLDPDQSQSLVYLVAVGSSLEDIQESYDRANYLYNTSFGIESPPDMTLDVCFGETTEVSIDGFTNLRWYDRFEGGNLLYDGETFVSDVLEDDITLYVAALDNSENESVRSVVKLNVGPSDEVSYEGDLVLCDGEVITLTASIGDEYLWSSGETTQQISVDSEGTYYVDVTNTSSNCTTRSENIDIVASSSPIIPVISAVEAFCLGDDLTLSVSNIDGGLTYRWEGPNDFTDEGSEIVISGFLNEQNGDYIVYAINNGCETGSESLSVTSEIQAPVVTFIDGVLSTSYVAESYLWYLDGSELSSETSNSMIPEISGTYKLEVTGSSCNAFSEDIDVVITGVKRLDNLVLYPNPTSSVLNINNKDELVNISVVDMSGRVQLNVKVNNRVVDVLNVAELNGGIYLLVLETSSGRTKSTSFIKK